MTGACFRGEVGDVAARGESLGGEVEEMVFAGCVVGNTGLDPRGLKVAGRGPTLGGAAEG